MTKLSVIAATFVLLISASTSQALQVSAEQRAACTPDVWRLCSAEIPHVSRIVACMKRQQNNLSPACKAVFTQ